MTSSLPGCGNVDGPGEIRLPVSDLQLDWWKREYQFLNPDLRLSRHVDVAGSLDERAFVRAAMMLTDRHEALRISFALWEGVPQQIVAPEGSAFVWVEDFSDLPPDRARAEAESVIERERNHPFILDRAPLVRFGAIRISARMFIVSLSLHHIIADGWALGVIMSELSDLYGRCRGGDMSVPDPAPLQLRQWVEREAAWHAGAQAAGEMKYWRENLRGLAPISLPYDRPPTTPLYYRCATRERELPLDLRGAAESAARKARATLSAVGMAAYFEVLAARTGRNDVATITIFNRRGSADLEGLVGCVMNAATIRVSGIGGLDSRSLIRRTADSVMAAHAHQKTFVSRIWDDMHLGPGSVDTLFIYDPPGWSAKTFGDEPAERHEYWNPRRYDRFGPWWENFKLRLKDSGDRLGVFVEYNSELYEESTVDGVLDDYVTVLTKLVS